MRTGISFGAALGVAVLGSVNAAGQAAQAPAGGRGAQPGLEPRIGSFGGRPATVRAGGPVGLVGQAGDPGGGAVAPALGAGAARGAETGPPPAAARPPRGRR